MHYHNAIKLIALNLDGTLRISFIRYAGAGVYDIRIRRLLHQFIISLEEALITIEYLQQIPTFIYVQTNYDPLNSSGWKKSGLIQKYPYIKLEENNVLYLKDFLKRHPMNIWEIGVFGLDEGTFHTLLWKGSPVF